VFDYRLEWGIVVTDPKTGGRYARLSNLVDVGNQLEGAIVVTWPNDGLAHSLFVVAIAWDGALESLTSNAVEINFP
jgi:hypothetical protein